VELLEMKNIESEIQISLSEIDSMNVTKEEKIRKLKNKAIQTT
jgi:hypothetical protein